MLPEGWCACRFPQPGPMAFTDPCTHRTHTTLIRPVHSSARHPPRTVLPVLFQSRQSDRHRGPWTDGVRSPPPCTTECHEISVSGVRHKRHLPRAVALYRRAPLALPPASQGGLTHWLSIRATHTSLSESRAEVASSSNSTCGIPFTQSVRA